MNAHHEEWLGSVSGTGRHGVVVYDFSKISGCVQLINGPTHNKLGNYLDLLLTDAPGIANSVVVLPLGKSDNSSISFTL